MDAIAVSDLSADEVDHNEVEDHLVGVNQYIFL